MEQSSSPTPPSHDQRSLTDLWRDAKDRRDTLQAIREHAHVEHPEMAWDAQAATFTTGRFAEGRAR